MCTDKCKLILSLFYRSDCGQLLLSNQDSTTDELETTLDYKHCICFPQLHWTKPEYTLKITEVLFPPNSLGLICLTAAATDQCACFHVNSTVNCMCCLSVLPWWGESRKYLGSVILVLIGSIKPVIPSCKDQWYVYSGWCDVQLMLSN